MERITLTDGELSVEFVRSDDDVVRLARLTRGHLELPMSSQALFQALTVSTGTGTTGRLDSTLIGADMLYVSHSLDGSQSSSTLTLHLFSPQFELSVMIVFELVEATSTVRVRTTVTNRTPRPQRLLAVSSVALGSPMWTEQGTIVHRADSEWLAESRWSSGTLQELGRPSISAAVHAAHVPRGAYMVTTRGTWSTGEHLPLGALENPGGLTLLWQIEHNGSWTWQVGKNLEGLSVVATGPTDRESGWSVELTPGESFTTADVTFTVSAEGVSGALGDLTRYRRATRRPSPTGTDLPVVYNDYMNTLMADPTAERVLPLVAAAGDVGADVFCIDAGWYADEAGWWDTVGEWAPSQTRFPRGIGEVIDAIRAEGMIPGLWLEPEVVGVRSPIVQLLPDEAFFLRGQEKVTMDGRHHLDLRHPMVIDRLDAVVDGLISEFGIGYFKFDYNVGAFQGTEVDATSPGHGQLLAARAFLQWVDRLLDRHPALIVEACASGGMRSDWATMSRFALLSTSDQQDALATVPIAAAAPSVVPPEQAGIWCYPQPGLTPREWSVAMVNGILARPYLSGFYDRMSASELENIRDFLASYRSISHLIATAIPSWPLGLPGWDDPWVATALNCGDNTMLLSVWRRGSTSPSVQIPLAPTSAGAFVSALYPEALDGTGWSIDGDVLTVTLPSDAAVCLRIDFPVTV
ncbi:MAG: glycoside hydrolase family 36 protein [Mycetocola sp.]